MTGLPAPTQVDAHGAAVSPTKTQIRRWRRYLAAERAEAAVYRDLASRRTGEEKQILLGLVEAEERHQQHWIDLLGERVGRPIPSDLRTRVLSFFARRYGSVFVLALMQRAEARSPYEADVDASPAMAADERIHGEVVRGLAERGRSRLSGSFRAAVFGMNDGLVSNLALVVGMSATGVGTSVVLASGVAGLLAGALSMGAGEYVSVRSQRELLEASTPDPDARTALPHLDVEANELALVYRARGMSEEEASTHAREVLHSIEHSADGPATGAMALGHDAELADAHESIGTAWGAAITSFFLFAAGAIIPVIPYLIGLSGFTAIAVAAVLVGAALLLTGASVGILSGASPLARALRQLAIGFGAAAVTYALGLLFGTSVG
ncbi:VIT1/CCC1 transporter family protein [Labedella endophytica]|uniref:Rubrerythrin family protein n=1 Tax=Labedella endophytica TaxID=1523160 RepID=A0A3S0VH16_9MICO|nr:rubrerythrin family protein [Labedella endophytica]